MSAKILSRVGTVSAKSPDMAGQGMTRRDGQIK
jgi:hypothetical protein